MPDRNYHVNAFPDAEGFYSITINGLGLQVTAGKDDEGQPYVSVNTERMPPEYVYDEATGLPGTARPYTVGEAGQGDSYEVIAPGGAPIAVHLPQPTSASARLAAKKHADTLNDEWATRCDMPILSVHLNDAELYDSRDHNPALRVESTPQPSAAGKLRRASRASTN